MKKKAIAPILSDGQISRLVLHVRGHKVMLDADLAALYGVPVKALNQAVKRNSERFPEDFAFQLTWEEFESLENLKSQIVTSNEIYDNDQIIVRPPIATLKGRGGVRKLPYAFTEQGIAMLSSVLRSERAVQVNIAIVRAFVSLRGMLRSQENIKQELAALKRQSKDHDEKIKTIFREQLLKIDNTVKLPF